MRSAAEVPAEYIVVDSGAFIKRAPLQDIGSKIYTVAEVLRELKCDKSRHLVDSIPYEILLKEPTSESIRIINDVSKKTGDYSVLSVVDIKVLALTHDLYVEQCSKSDLTYDIRVVKSIDDTAFKSKSVDDVTNNEGNVNFKKEESEKNDLMLASDVAGFYKPLKKKFDERSEVSDSEEACSSSEDENGWITEANFDKTLKQIGAVVVPETNVKVACITTDFAMQNVLLHIGLPLLSLEGYRIRRLNSYILRCSACYMTTSDMERRFCKQCGNEALHRVAVTVNDDGSMQMHFNWRRLNCKRGLKYSLPAPKGGKHANDPQLFEDQRIPQNRMAKHETDPLSSDPFDIIDVTSRSAALGIRSWQTRNRGNPNIPKGGKKRGGKKR